MGRSVLFNTNWPFSSSEATGTVVSAILLPPMRNAKNELTCDFFYVTTTSVYIATTSLLFQSLPLSNHPATDLYCPLGVPETFRFGHIGSPTRLVSGDFAAKNCSTYPLNTAISTTSSQKAGALPSFISGHGVMIFTVLAWAESWLCMATIIGINRYQFYCRILRPFHDLLTYQNGGLYVDVPSLQNCSIFITTIFAILHFAYQL